MQSLDTLPQTLKSSYHPLSAREWLTAPQQLVTVNIAYFSIIKKGTEPNYDGQY
ncbi:hypothetical protein [Anaerospora hongkongensis]|uniref:hypothetical protein n=1 Tax=Anaerospora hongkongensis TaxID=244830 RepID=UPI0014054FC6|nr:hypothetical protein [Anaerospora hongkongensis]